MTRPPDGGMAVDRHSVRRGPAAASANAEPRVIGDPALLRLPSLALLASRRTPPDLILPTFDLARRFRDSGTAVVSGFHSEIERYCLRLLLRGAQPVVICPARSLAGMGIPAGWRVPLADGRLAIASALAPRWRRASAESARLRNATILRLSASLFVVYAAPGSQTFDLATKALDSGMRVECLEHPGNRELILLGAEAIDSDADE